MHTLYRFYAADDSLLYVGITNNPARRFSKHRDEKDWWLDVTRIEMEQFDSREALLSAEKVAIKTESPALNIRLNRGTPRPEPVAEPAQDVLVGLWFHSYEIGNSGEEINWQGKVLGRADRSYLVQLFSWWTGEPTDQVLVRDGDMRRWKFYPTSLKMQAALGCSERFMSQKSADRHNGGEERCRGLPAFVTSLGNVVCSRCSEFYTEVELLP